MSDLIIKGAKLAEVLQPLNPTGRLYILSILRGYSEAESRDLAKGLGTNIDRYLIDPQISELRQYFLDNGWRKRSEVEEEWKRLLTGSYVELIIMKGIGELGKSREERDNTLIKEAVKCAIAQRDRGQAQAVAGSYDEMILKKHRKVNDE